MIILTAAAAVVVAAQGEPRSAKEGVYTTAQADRGKVAYTAQCAECHGSMATPFPELAPLLNDYVFQGTWKNRTVGDLFERIRETMPQRKPRSLSPEQTAEIVAYILSANKLPAGQAPLAHDAEALKQIRLDTEP